MERGVSNRDPYEREVIERFLAPDACNLIDYLDNEWRYVMFRPMLHRGGQSLKFYIQWKDRGDRETQGVQFVITEPNKLMGPRDAIWIYDKCRSMFKKGSYQYDQWQANFRVEELKVNYYKWKAIHAKAFVKGTGNRKEPTRRLIVRGSPQVTGSTLSISRRPRRIKWRLKSRTGSTPT